MYFETLPADLKDRAHVRIECTHHTGDGFEFIFEEQPQHFGEGAAARPCDADSFHPIFGYDVVEIPQQVVGGLNRAPGDALVFGKHQRPPVEFGEAELWMGLAELLQYRLLARISESSQFEADGANIQADINPHSFQCAV